MQNFPRNHSCTIRNSIETLTGPNPFQSPSAGTPRIVLAFMFRSIARVAVLLGVVSVSVLAPLANAQISPDFPNPIAAPNPLTTTLSIFRSNMQDKIMKAAEAMPESKYSYRPTKDVRSFGEILTHVADISYYLCANAKGENPPGPAAAKGTKAEIMTYVKGAFAYCDGAFSGFTDAHLNAPADFAGIHARNRHSAEFSIEPLAARML